MIGVTFRPMVAWLGEETKRRTRSQFSAGLSSTMALMDRELRALAAERVVVQIDLGEDDIRLDGWPRSAARPEHPGIAVSFESKYGPLRYACDRFDRWQDNLRAIALGLEALRKVDRYGITKSGEQYTGWRQLTAGPSGPSSRQEAIAVLASFSHFETSDIADGRAKEAYREALKRTHPDTGGDGESFSTVREAGRILGLNQ